MSHIFVGASASTDAAPCQTLEGWQALLAAMERGDDEAIIAITTNTKPTLVPVAQLHGVTPNPPKTLKEAAEQFWTKHGRGTLKAHAPGPDGIPVVLAVPR